MPQEDPLRAAFFIPTSKTVFAASQLFGTRKKQEDYFLNFNDECIAVADGVGGMPHGDVAAKLASETAIWAYRHVRLRPNYWKNRKLFLNRIFRTTNIAVWHKHREEGFAEGLATTLLVCILGDRLFWVGSVGDSRAFLLREGDLRLLTHDDVDATGRLTKAIGVERYGLVPQIFSDSYRIGDTILLATDGVTRAVGEDEMKNLLVTCGSTTQSLSNTVVEILKTAQGNGSTDNMTVILIKRVAIE